MLTTVWFRNLHRTQWGQLVQGISSKDSKLRVTNSQGPTSSHTRLAVDARDPQRLSGVWRLEHLRVASPCGLGFRYAGQLGSKS